MRISKALLIIVIFLCSGCVSSKFHKCSSLTGWCANMPTPEIVYWAIKDEKYKVTESCCSVVWDQQMRQATQRKRNIFRLCGIDVQTGTPLNQQSQEDGTKCLERNGLYRYVKR